MRFLNWICMVPTLSTWVLVHITGVCANKSFHKLHVSSSTGYISWVREESNLGLVVKYSNRVPGRSILQDRQL